MLTSLLPYVLVPAVGILIVYAWRTLCQSSPWPGPSGERAIGLMVLRQVLTIVENARPTTVCNAPIDRWKHKND